MRRSILVAVIALTALAASAAIAKNPAVPAGTWDLHTTKASYSGPSTRLKSVLAKLIKQRVIFSPACTPTLCATYATVTTIRGQRVRFRLVSKASEAFTGRVLIATGIRCGRKPLKAQLEMTASMIQLQQPSDRLIGATSAVAVNPGNCPLFRGFRRAVRKTQYFGAAVSG